MNTLAWKSLDHLKTQAHEAEHSALPWAFETISVKPGYELLKTYTGNPKLLRVEEE